MTPIRSVRLILRVWRDGDRALFHRINSDDRVMEVFAFRRDRVRLPMLPTSRSLNLANAAAVAVYEAWRQHGFRRPDGP